MRISRMRNVLSMLLISLLSYQATAEQWNDNLHLNGFFTLDITQSSDDVVLISNSTHNAPYESDKPSLRNSLLGGQLAYQVNDDLKAVVQAKAHVNRSNDISGSVDWAYLSYDAGNDLKLRLGKFQVPFMQGIELRNISYSRLWARPLINNTGAGGFSEFIGGEVLKNYSQGKNNWQFQFSAGKAEHGRVEYSQEYIAMMSLRFQRDNFWIRTALLNATYHVETRDGRSLTDSGDALMISIEAEYLHNNFIFNAGYADSKADVSPDDSSYYLSVGYYFDNLVPFINWHRQKQHFDLIAASPPPVRPANGPNRPTGPPPFPLGDSSVNSHAVGVKYNFAEQYALKLQVEHVKTEDRARPNGVNASVNALTLAIEGVF